MDLLAHALTCPATLPSRPMHILLVRVRVRPATPQIVDLLLVATVRIRLAVPLLVMQTRTRILYLVEQPTLGRMRSLRVGTPMGTMRAKVRGPMVFVPKVPRTLQQPVIRAVADFLVAIELCSLTDRSMHTGSGVKHICGLR